MGQAGDLAPAGGGIALALMTLAYNTLWKKQNKDSCFVFFRSTHGPYGLSAPEMGFKERHSEPTVSTRHRVRYYV